MPMTKVTTAIYPFGQRGVRTVCYMLLKSNTMKKKIVFSLLLVLLMEPTVLSQTYVFQVIQMGSKNWGYAGLDGKLIIEPKFKVSNEFSEQGNA